MKVSHFGIFVSLILLVLSACTAVKEPAADDMSPDHNTAELPDAVTKAQEAVSEKTGVSIEQVRVLSYEEVEWSDGCLGVNQPDMMCVQVITPGYRVILEVDGQEYEVHTNSDGSAVIIVP